MGIKKWSLIGFIVVVVIMVSGFIYGVSYSIVKSTQPPVAFQIPDNPAYKQETMFNKFESWAVYDTRGYRYEVSKSDFNSLAVPQKVGDGLYKLPDGNYVSGLIK
jgi:hypothetical protein